MIIKNDSPRISVSPNIRRKMVELARGFRKEPTQAEKILWGSLRGKRFDGIKFRRQQPIGYFVVDFYDSAHRLVIEVDGPVHEIQKEADAARQEILEELGLFVLRIKSETVETNLPKALDLIRDAIQERSRQNVKNIPSPSVGEGKGGG